MSLSDCRKLKSSERFKPADSTAAETRKRQKIQKAAGKHKAGESGSVTSQLKVRGHSETEVSQSSDRGQRSVRVQ